MGKFDDRLAKAAKQFVDTERDGAAWTRFDDYKKVPGDDGYYIVSRGEGHTYRPLYDELGMFAGLAQIGARFGGPDDTFNAADSALEFARKYGVLGLSPVPPPTRKPDGGLILKSTGDPGDLLLSFGTGDHTRDSVAAFVQEAWTAARAREFYMASRDGDLETIERLDWPGEFRPVNIPHGAPPRLEAYMWGTNAAAELAQGRVVAWCAPAVYWRDGRLVRGYGFKNLAGAAWFQFLTLLTAGDAERCKNDVNCPYDRPVIFHDDGEEGRRKEYCYPECRMRFHYETKTKPRRREARAAK